jgi:hypothetical protein
MPTLEFYAERAAQCRREADTATLANVRQRHLDAAEAWDGMAERITRTNAHREANLAGREAVEGQASL